MKKNINLIYAFPSYLNPKVEEVDSQVSSWAQERGLLKSDDEVEQYRKMKITWFAARLYPFSAQEKLVMVAKLFCILFLIDDYTDVALHKISFWKKIRKNLRDVMEDRLLFSQSELINCFAEIWKQLVLWGDEEWLGYAKDVFSDFLDAGVWEAGIRQRGIIPSIPDYLRFRIEFSGVRIAFLLIPLVDGDSNSEMYKHPDFNPLRNQAGRIIFLANDLMSYHKETETGDWNNLVRLVQRENELSLPEAFNKVFDLHYREVAKFHQLERELSDCGTPEINAYIVALRHMIAGSAEWSSEDTDRYMLGNNGQSMY